MSTAIKFPAAISIIFSHIQPQRRNTDMPWPQIPDGNGQ